MYVFFNKISRTGRRKKLLIKLKKEHIGLVYTRVKIVDIDQVCTCVKKPDTGTTSSFPFWGSLLFCMETHSAFSWPQSTGRYLFLFLTDSLLHLVCIEFGWSFDREVSSGRHREDKMWLRIHELPFATRYTGFVCKDNFAASTSFPFQGWREGI